MSGGTARAGAPGRPSPAAAPGPRQRRPNDRFERSLADEGFELVAGLDEVGRGAWAGPVSVGVVVFPLGRARPDGAPRLEDAHRGAPGGALPPDHRVVHRLVGRPRRSRSSATGWG